MSERLISLSQLSDESGVSLRDLADDAVSGELPAHRVAGRWVVDRAEIAEYLDDVSGDDEEDEDDDDGECDDE